MALADEEAKAAAWRDSQQNRLAATQSRAQALSGSAPEYTELLDDWTGLVTTGNAVPIQQFGSEPTTGGQQPLPSASGATCDE